MSKQAREDSRAARAAAIQKQQASRERNRRLLITGVIVAVLAAVVAAGVLLTGGDKPDGRGDTPPAAVEGQALVLGDNADAPTVVIWEDFLCPYCREFESASRDLLHRKASSGDARVEYRPFQLLQDPYSRRSLSAWAAVLQKGTPEQALAFHDLLFENQPYEAAKNKPDTDKIVDLAREAGVDDKGVLKAAAQDDPEFVQAAGAAAREASVQGTPTVLVDGKKLEGASVADMVDNLEKMLQG